MTARIGAPKTGGRVKGRSLDKGQRLLVTSEMAGDLLTVYKRLGGVKWLLRFAEDNPKEFLQLGLSRLFPAAPKDDEPAGTYNQFNFNSQDTFEAARRVAFALNLGLHAQQELAPVAERELPLEQPVAEVEETYDAPGHMQHAAEQPVEDPDYQRYIKELSLSPEQRRDNAVVRNTKECDITNYCGSSAEQGGSGPVQRQVVTNHRPTIAEKVRSQAQRRRDLL